MHFTLCVLAGLAVIWARRVQPSGGAFAGALEWESENMLRYLKGEIADAELGFVNLRPESYAKTKKTSKSLDTLLLALNQVAATRSQPRTGCAQMMEASRVESMFPKLPSGLSDAERGWDPYQEPSEEAQKAFNWDSWCDGEAFDFFTKEMTAEQFKEYKGKYSCFWKELPFQMGEEEKTMVDELLKTFKVKKGLTYVVMTKEEVEKNLSRTVNNTAELKRHITKLNSDLDEKEESRKNIIKGAEEHLRHLMKEEVLAEQEAERTQKAFDEECKKRGLDPNVKFKEFEEMRMRVEKADPSTQLNKEGDTAVKMSEMSEEDREKMLKKMIAEYSEKNEEDREKMLKKMIEEDREKTFEAEREQLKDYSELKDATLDLEAKGFQFEKGSSISMRMRDTMDKMLAKYAKDSPAKTTFLGEAEIPDEFGEELGSELSLDKPKDKDKLTRLQVLEGRLATYKAQPDLFDQDMVQKLEKEIKEALASSESLETDSFERKFGKEAGVPDWFPETDGLQLTSDELEALQALQFSKKEDPDEQAREIFAGTRKIFDVETRKIVPELRKKMSSQKDK